MKSPEIALKVGDPGDSRNFIELWICVRRTGELQIPAISILDDLIFEYQQSCRHKNLNASFVLKLTSKGGRADGI